MHANYSRRAYSVSGCVAQQSSCIGDGADKTKAFGGASRWTAVELDGQTTIISAHLLHKGKKLGRFRVGFEGNPGFHEWKTRTAPDPGWRLQCELARIDRPSPCWRVDPKTDLTVANTWMDADSEPELFTRSSWSDPVESLTQMDFIMSSRT